MTKGGENLKLISHTAENAIRAYIGMALDHLDAPIFIKDARLCWVYVNQAACVILGVAKERLVGQTLEAAYPQYNAQFFEPYERQVLTDGKPVVFEWTMDWTGTERTLVVRLSRFETPSGEPHLAGHFSDVTALKRIEEEKHTQEAYYQSLFENTGSGTVILNNDGLILSCNAQYEQLTGYSKKEIVGISTWKDFVSPKEVEWLMDYHQRRLDVTNPPPREYDVDFLTKQGELRTAHAVIDVIPETTDRVISFIDVTKRKATEEALAESLTKYKALIETTDTGFVIVSEDGIILDANDEYCRITGRPREKVIGFPARDWLVPSEKQRCREAFQEGLRTGKMRHFQTYYQLPDGTGIAIEANATRIETDGKVTVISLIRDISERKRAEDALRASEQRLRSLVDTMPVLIHAYDADGKVIFWNKECERVLGWTAQELTEMSGNHSQLYASASHHARLMQASNAASGAYCEYEVPMVAKDGEIRMISWTSRAAEMPIPGWHIWETGIDVTDRRQYLSQLAQLNKHLEDLVGERTAALTEQTRALEIANQKLQEIDACKSTFLNTVSHDIRTPLTSILGFSKLIEREFDHFYKGVIDNDVVLEKRADRVSAHFKVIQHEGDRLKRLIDDFLDISKIESGQVFWNDKPVVFFELANRVRNVFEQRYGCHLAIDFIVTISDKLPTLVMDSDRLLQILFNLIDNAFKFTPAGEVKLQVDAPDPRHVQFMVSDTGIGIEEDQLERIFEDFVQAPKSDTLKHPNEGTGLGLAVCRRIVAHYHGKIWAESREGEGTTVYVLLPGRERAS